jgi:uncharacterized protein
MFRVTVRFYEELNDFLEPARRKRDMEILFPERRSVKDLVESLGVPHVEVDLILANGEAVGFGYIVRDGDRISVYPVFETLDIGPVTRLRPEPLREPRFVLDVHLQKLARRLRLLGFDVDFSPARDDDELADIAEAEDRILLSRDRQLMMRRKVARGLYVRNTDPERQVTEMLDRLDLRAKCRPFTRCIECNGPIAALDPDGPGFADAAEGVPPGVRSWCREYYRCGGCGRVYWKGSHYEKLARTVDAMLDTGEGRGGGCPMNDADFMLIALDYAREAAERGEIPVGSVVVKDGAVIAAARNDNREANNPVRHAEINAIEKACAAVRNERLTGCDLYVTKEPCAMCAGAIVHARIRRLVIGARDSRYGACGTVLSVCGNASLNHAPMIEFGLLEDEAAALLKEFFRLKRQ